MRSGARSVAGQRRFPVGRVSPPANHRGTGNGATMNSDLTEFLLARIAEDEADAREAHREGHRWLVEDNTITLWPGTDADGVMGFPLRAHARHAVYWQPDRVLAECEAKRKIIDKIIPEIRETEELAAMEFGGSVDDECSLKLLRLLAVPYADHEEFQEEWRP